MKRNDLLFKGKHGEFHYIDWGGRGPLTHFAHAAGLCAGVYTRVVDGLLSRLKVIGLDFRGHGRTDAPASPSLLKNWDIFHDDLRSFIKHLNHPIIAIGHSLGGTVSLKVAACQPELVSALILIEPGIVPPSWRPWVFFAQKSGLFRFVPFVRRVSKRTSKWANSGEAWDSFNGRGPFKNWRDEFLRAYLDEGMITDEDGNLRLSCNPVWEGRCLAMAPCDIWKFVPRIKVPTLVLYGARSTTFLPSVIERFRAEVPHAVMKEFKNTGHFVPMERPIETVSTILDFLTDQKITSQARFP